MKKIIGILTVIMVIFVTTTSWAGEKMTPNKLTHGTVKKFIEKGKTAQAEILELFGGPNITTISKAGDEVWTYERMSYTTTTHGGADPRMILLGGATGAGVGAIIGSTQKKIGEGALIGGAVGGLAGLLASWVNPVHESGSRTVTFMIWFDENDIVKDYSIISTQY